MVEASDGNFYGTTSSGGQSFRHGVRPHAERRLRDDRVVRGRNRARVGRRRARSRRVPTGLSTARRSAAGTPSRAAAAAAARSTKIAQGVPTTTSTTTSSSTTSAIATTSTTATPPPTTIAVTTSTAVQLPNPTTTTLPTSGCPSGSTFASVRCRLEALRAALAAESGLGSYQAKLGKNVDKALGKRADAEGLCASNGKNDAKKAKSRLAQVKKGAHAIRPHAEGPGRAEEARRHRAHHVPRRRRGDRTGRDGAAGRARVPGRRSAVTAACWARAHTATATPIERARLRPGPEQARVGESGRVEEETS